MSREKSASLPVVGGCARAAAARGRRRRAGQLADRRDLVAAAAHSRRGACRAWSALARVTQLICRSSSEIDCSIRRAAACALSSMPVGQCGPGAAVADPGFHRAVDGEHEHDEADEGDDVFGEQTLAQKPCLVVDRAIPTLLRRLRRRRCGVLLSQFGRPAEPPSMVTAISPHRRALT